MGIGIQAVNVTRIAANVPSGDERHEASPSATPLALSGLPADGALACSTYLTSRHTQSSEHALKPCVSAPHKAVLMGICGIGRGHLSRQAPVLHHLLDAGHRVMAFTYGEGRATLERAFGAYSTFAAVDVFNPYFVGAPEGLDFTQTAAHPHNRVDATIVNAAAMAQAQAKLGTPDLVISDYEQTSAQYAYAKGAPLLTLDQQSKYLTGTFDPDLAGTSYRDEVERLRMFFPTAAARLAVSFFAVSPSPSPAARVEVLPPMIRPELHAARSTPLSAEVSLLVYLTSQQLGEQPVDAWAHTLDAALPASHRAHMFVPQRLALPQTTPRVAVAVYPHGDARFDAALAACHGVVSTAGHTLLSESMFLEKPVYALPLPLYEQQLNAQVIADGKFGIAAASLTAADLGRFLSGLDTFRENIRNDRSRLLKGTGNARVLEAVDRLLHT